MGLGGCSGQRSSAARGPLLFVLSLSLKSLHPLLWPDPPCPPSWALLGGSYLLLALWPWLASDSCPPGGERASKHRAGKSPLMVQQETCSGQRHE